MKKFFQTLSIIASVVTILVFLGSIFIFKGQRIKIQCHTERMLSFGTKVDSFVVQYKGAKIDDVWKTRIILNNSGKQPIIGCGPSSALLNDRLILNIDTSYQIISYNVSKNDFCAKYKQSENSFIISFKKWKPNEEMQFEVLLTTQNNKVSPSISVNERDVTGADVIFHNLDIATIEESSNNLDWLIDLKSVYPSFLFKIAKYVGLFFFGLFAFTPIIVLVQFIQGQIKYSNWKKKNWKKFLRELGDSQIPIVEREQYKYKPYKVPKEYHLKFTSIPEAPDSFGMFIYMLIGMSLLFCPFVVYAFFAWFNL